MPNPDSRPKVYHMRDTGIFLKSRIEIPVCMANHNPIDYDKAMGLYVTVRREDVNCKRCRKLI